MVGIVSWNDIYLPNATKAWEEYHLHKKKTFTFLVNKPNILLFYTLL